MPCDGENASPLREYGAFSAGTHRCLYGRYKAKLCLPPDFGAGKSGKLVLVTAVTPTSAGEGKTTVTIGLADGLRRLGRSAVLALREPSLGPVFGLKGGATGGGHAQIVPMEDINLHFTGDIHAVGAANNLLAAMLDNRSTSKTEPSTPKTHIMDGSCLRSELSTPEADIMEGSPALNPHITHGRENAFVQNTVRV